MKSLHTPYILQTNNINSARRLDTDHYEPYNDQVLSPEPKPANMTKSASEAKIITNRITQYLPFGQYQIAPVEMAHFLNQKLDLPQSN